MRTRGERAGELSEPLLKLKSKSKTKTNLIPLSNRSKLIKLLRYKTSSSQDESWEEADGQGPKDDGYEWRSLEEYVAGMKDWQSNIYWIAGESLRAIQQSPFLEQCRAKGVEVLLLTDPIDEYAIQQIPEFDGHRLMSITKDGLKFGDEDSDVVEKRMKMYESKFKPLLTYLQFLYNGDETVRGYSNKHKSVDKVKISSRLHTTPTVLVTGQYGNSANMERIMRAQAFSDRNEHQYLNSQRTMEINPRHPLMVTMLEQVLEDPESQELEDNAMILLDTAGLSSGFYIDNVELFADRMYRMLKKTVGVESFELEPELEVPEEEEEEVEEVNVEEFEGMSSEDEKAEEVEAEEIDEEAMIEAMMNADKADKADKADSEL